MHAVWVAPACVQYNRRDVIGEGAYSVVFRGVLATDASPVAVKEVRLTGTQGAPLGAPLDPLTPTCCREVLLLSRMLRSAHPGVQHVVRLLDVQRTRDGVLLVLQLAATDVKTAVERARQRAVEAEEVHDDALERARASDAAVFATPTATYAPPWLVTGGGGWPIPDATRSSATTAASWGLREGGTYVEGFSHPAHTLTFTGDEEDGEAAREASTQGGEEADRRVLPDGAVLTKRRRMEDTSPLERDRSLSDEDEDNGDAGEDLDWGGQCWEVPSAAARSSPPPDAPHPRCAACADIPPCLAWTPCAGPVRRGTQRHSNAAGGCRPDRRPTPCGGSGGSSVLVLSPALVRTWSAQLLGGLAALHDAGIMHRDVNPSNLLLLRDGTLQVGDLGLGRVWDDSRFGGAHATATAPSNTAAPPPERGRTVAREVRGQPPPRNVQVSNNGLGGKGTRRPTCASLPSCRPCPPQPPPTHHRAGTWARRTRARSLPSLVTRTGRGAQASPASAGREGRGWGVAIARLLPPALLSRPRVPRPPREDAAVRPGQAHHA